jgi:hypothetical protein
LPVVLHHQWDQSAWATAHLALMGSSMPPAQTSKPGQCRGSANQLVRVLDGQQPTLADIKVAYPISQVALD